MKQERIVWIDSIKGTLLILICMGHIPEIPPYISWILSPTATFYVPLFFIISGSLLNTKRDIKTYIAHQTKRLLFPYILLGLIIILCDWNTYLIYPDSLLTNLDRLFIRGLGVEKAAPLWFVLALYAGTIIGYSTLYFFKSNIIRCSFILAYSLIAEYLSFSNIQLPFAAHLWPSSAVLILGGFYIKQHLSYLSNHPKQESLIKLLTFVIGSIGLILPLGDMHLNVISSYPLFYICPMAAYLCIVLFYKERNVNISILNWVAKNGLAILGTHCYFIIIISQLLSHCLNLNDTFYLKYLLCLGIVSILLYYAIIPFINKYLYYGNRTLPYKQNK